jgi:putative membrane protein
MKRQIIHKLTASMMIAAGILIGVPETTFAQAQSQSKSGAQQPKSHSNHGTSTSAAKGANKTKGMSQKPNDANFVKKASESNLAEIKLSELALQKASSDKVKEYAQTMIQHHTMAQTELASIVSSYTSSSSGRPGAAGNDANDASDSDKMSTENSSGGTTATGSTYASGNAGGAVGTTNSTAGKSADGAASQNTPSNGSNNSNTNNQADANATTNPAMGSSQVGRGQMSDPNNTSPAQSNNANTTENQSDGTGGGGPGANSGGTTSSTTNGRISRTTPESQNDSQGQSTSANSGSMMSGQATGSSTMKYDLPNELSAEHKALRDKLSKLSGAEFDKQYMQVMLKDHAKSVELFEKQAMMSNEGDNQLKEYATKNLPLIKEHYEMAKSLSGNSGMNNSSSKKGSE